MNQHTDTLPAPTPAPANAAPAFVAVVQAPAGDDVLRALRGAVDGASQSWARWLVAPPEVRTAGRDGVSHAGVVLRLLPLDGSADPARLVQQMPEIRALVCEMRRLNHATGLDVRFEIDGRHVTRIFDGRFEEPLEAALKAVAPARYGAAAD